MALAKAMLQRDAPPLEAVAAAIGYQSASAFSTAFRREVGSPPSHFRSHHNRLTASQPQGAASGVQAQRRHAGSAADRVIDFPGTGIQDNLADKAKMLGIPVFNFRPNRGGG